MLREGGDAVFGRWLAVYDNHPSPRTLPVASRLTQPARKGESASTDSLKQTLSKIRLSPPWSETSALWTSALNTKSSVSTSR